MKNSISLPAITKLDVSVEIENKNDIGAVAAQDILKTFEKLHGEKPTKLKVKYNNNPTFHYTIIQSNTSFIVARKNTNNVTTNTQKYIFVDAYDGTNFWSLRPGSNMLTFNHDLEKKLSNIEYALDFALNAKNIKYHYPVFAKNYGLPVLPHLLSFSSNRFSFSNDKIKLSGDVNAHANDTETIKYSIEYTKDPQIKNHYINKYLYSDGVLSSLIAELSIEKNGVSQNRLNSKTIYNYINQGKIESEQFADYFSPFNYYEGDTNNLTITSIKNGKETIDFLQGNSRPDGKTEGIKFSYLFVFILISTFFILLKVSVSKKIIDYDYK